MNKFRKIIAGLSVVTILGAGAASSATAYNYIIKSGDTLWAIATTNGTTVSKLMNDNNLSSSLIFPGDVLSVGSKTTATTKKTASAAKTTATSTNFNYNTAMEVYNQLNAYRLANGLNALAYNGSVDAGTEIRATEFATKVANGYSYAAQLHTRLNGSAWYTAFSNVGYVALENLSYSSYGASGLMGFWKSSYAHNAAMLNPYVTKVSIKVYQINGVSYGVQIFS